ncbi:MAG: hypothetical protein PVG35_19385 [Desulfobacterales bacterium]
MINGFLAEEMMTMRYCKMMLSCWLFMMLCSTAMAYDFQQGIHGMKWGSSVSENAGLSKVRETELATYYARANTYYQLSRQAIPGVFYAFYDDKFFAVFVKLRSPDQFSKLKQAFGTKYGAAKTSINNQSKQQVYRWKDGDVKIKLKMIEAKGQYKMAFYYAPLSTKLNEERLENIPPEMFKLLTPKEGESAKAVPLLGE